MEQHLAEIRDQQKQSWNKFSPGWKKWDKLTMDFLKPMGDEIIRRLNPTGDEEILDIAAGTGEPGLTIATMLNENGRVTITDLSEGMLAIAKENAQARGIENIETVVCDANELPFENEHFDAISCRMGFMFFPDMLQAAKEMYRVLKPGGRIAASVWYGPEKNFWITAVMGTINKNIEIPAPPPNSPGMFRCAKDGFMVDMLQQAGFVNTVQQEVEGQLKTQTTDTYWSFMTEVAAPVVAALAKADDEKKEKIKSEVYQQVNSKYPDGHVVIDCGALVVYGEKPLQKD